MSSLFTSAQKQFSVSQHTSPATDRESLLVPRVLFPVDQRSVSDFSARLERELSDDVNQKTIKYSFDFQNDQPLLRQPLLAARVAK
jgi:hypothetical protein